MVDEISIEDLSETERLRGNINDIRKNRLDAARSVQGDFLIEEEQVGIDSAERIKDKSGVELLGSSASAGAQDTLAATIGREIGVTTSGISFEFNGNKDFGIKSMADDILRSSEKFDDPNWNPREDETQLALINAQIETLGLDVEGPQAESLMSSTSELMMYTTAEFIKEDQERMQSVTDAGPMGLAAYMAATLADIDSLTGIAVFTKLRKARKASHLNKLVKAGDISEDEAKLLEQTSTRFENLKRGAEAGAGSALVVEGGRALLDPSADEKDVIGAIVLSSILGSSIGAALPRIRADEVAKDIALVRLMEQSKAVETETFFGDLITKKRTKSPHIKEEIELKDAADEVVEDVDIDVQPEIDLDQSVGAASTGQPGDVSQPKSSTTIQQEAWDFLEDNPEIDAAFRGLDDFIDPKANIAQRMAQRLGERIYKGIQKTPFISDYDRLVKDGGPVMRHLAFLTLESPVGQIVNNRSAAARADLINREAAAHYAPNAAKHFSDWAKDHGIRKVSKRYVWDAHLEYGKELQLYRETIHAGKAPDVNTHPSIKAASEDMDRAYRTMLDNMKKNGVEGFEDIEFINGYTPRKWRGEKFSLLETKAGIGSERIVQALKEGIMAKTPDMDDTTAFIYATAIRRAAKNSQLQSPVGSLMTVNVQGVTALEQAIQDLGLDKAAGRDATEMAKAILFKDSERGTVSSSRRRINIDMTTPIKGTDNSLIDLVDNDIYAVTDRSIRGQSNHAALAGVGIQNRDKEQWIRAAMDEAESLGNDPAKARNAVDDVFSYYGEGAFAGGQGPISGRLNKLAILSFLPQLGITQMAEAGVAMGTAGIRGWSRFAGKTVKDMVSGKDPEVMNSLWGINAYAADHRLWVSTDHLDDVSLEDANHYMRTVDRAMDKGMRGMGYISGFYKVNEFLHQTSALSMNNYMIRSIVDNKNARRLSTMGVDTEFRALINKHIENGNIQFDNGFVKDMGAEKWEPDELDLLRAVTRRNMDQTVQKARRGEAHAWQYQQIGSLFASLKSFTFTAAQKQLVKNLRIADPEALQMVLTTTGTAALAYASKQLVNGNLDSMDMDRLVQGALNWSPLLSPALMAVDPFSYMIGLDKLPGSPFPLNDWRYGSQGLISMPAGITALSQLAGLGRIPAEIIKDGKLSRASINAVKSIPVIGRSYPMVPLIEKVADEFKESDRAERLAKEKREARKRAKQQ